MSRNNRKMIRHTIGKTNLIGAKRRISIVIIEIKFYEV